MAQNLAFTMAASLPQLNQDNHRLWRRTIEHPATGNDIMEQLSGDPTTSQASDPDFNTRRSQAACLIMNTIIPTLLNNLSADFRDKSPHEMMKEIDKYFAEEFKPCRWQELP